MVLYYAISGPKRNLSELPDVTLAAVVVIATVGVIDPPLPPSGGFFPYVDQKRRGAGRENGLRISDPFVAISSNMGGIPPARFANHAPFSVVFPNATICGKRCRHLSIITLPLAAGVGSITTIAIASTIRQATSAAAYTSASSTAPILGEFGLGLIDPILVNRLRHLGTP